MAPLSSLLTLCALVLSVNAFPAPESYRLHEERSTESIQWEKRSRVKPDILLPVRIGLTQSNLDNGPTLLDEVSNPDSPRYGEHYTMEEIHDIFAPTSESVEGVKGWLQDSGVHPDRVSQSVNKQWIQFDAPVHEVENLLQTEYFHYEHLASGKSNIGCDRYHVPGYLTEHVDYITPGLKLLTPSMSRNGDRKTLEKRIFGVTDPDRKPTEPLKKPLPQSVGALLALDQSAACQQAITPDCIFTMYNITQPNKSNAGNKLGIFESLGDKYAQQDLNSFFATIAPQIPQGTHPVLEAIDGATAPATTVANAGAESNLDIEISLPLIYPQGAVLFQTDDDYYETHYTFNGFLNNFLDAIDGSYCTYSAYGETGNSPLDPPYPDPNTGGYKGRLQCGVYKPTNVISISYGGQEADLPASYQKRQCNEYMKLGLAGVSIVVASGDSGVSGPGGRCLGPGNNIFSPDFPATCPYLTTAGATYLPAGGNVTQDREVAVSRFPSGGGFSNIYGIPSYQKSAVQNYFAKYPPPYPYYSSTNNDSFGANGGIYNRNGRGYPDISAVGDNILIFTGGAPTLIGGTSASTPVFAAILTRINEERIAIGKKPVGFVNPTLYANPTFFHDITVGNNPGCNTNGFAVTKGWDPVTGLGTPNYRKLVAYFVKLK